MSDTIQNLCLTAGGAENPVQACTRFLVNGQVSVQELKPVTGDASGTPASFVKRACGPTADDYWLV